MPEVWICMTMNASALGGGHVAGWHDSRESAEQHAGWLADSVLRGDRLLVVGPLPAYEVRPLG